MHGQMKVAARGDASLLLSAEAASDRDQAAAPANAVQRLFARTRFASLSSTLLGASASGPPPPVKERRTGVAFPGDYCLREGQSSCPIVTGTGVRVKRIAGIKNLDIYALGLYVDRRAAHSALHGKFRGADADSLAHDQVLFDELVKHDSIEKTLRVVITSGLVNNGNFLKALEERLAPPLKQAGELSALEAFKQQFDGLKFRKGLEITFTTTTNGTLVMRADGREVGSISNRLLMHSLLDIYVGPDPASQAAKDSFGAGLAGMVLA